ncbi:MAG TPA: class I SAM-dependent methyltransferase [Thermoanaerobaculia bacterium]|nr:class I SAM-dependent methyltransferase [Thermoanaerobaculia bacterium]
MTDPRDAGARVPAPVSPVLDSARARALAYAETERHPLVEAFVAARCGGRGRPRLDVAAGDEMLHYALAEQFQHRGLALFSYLRSGLTAAETLEQILGWRFGDPARTPSLLDFASGYGRVTRFLAQTVGAERITVGEISRGAVEFQRRLLGVDAVLSTALPCDLELGRRHAAVAVLSLFTHLPDSSFRAWLARLWGAVDEGGVLVFSVNDEAVLFPGRAMPAEGLYFEPVSENAELAAADYGTTWVAERWVARAIDAACGGATRYLRIPRGLWHFQDLYVVARAPAPAHLGPCAVELPPEGYLDACIPVAPDRVRVSGWAIDRGAPETPPRITIEIDGVVRAETRAVEEREDLAAVHGAAHLRSGFVAEVASGGGALRPDQILAVRATSSGGRDTLLHLSPVEGADLGRRVAGALDEVRGENLHLRRANADLHRKIELMEQSRFWKLRNLWWRLRGRR